MYSSSLVTDVDFDLKVTVSKSGEDFIITDVQTLGGRSVLLILTQDDLMEIDSYLQDEIPREKLDGEHLVPEFALRADVLFTFVSYKERGSRFYEDVEIDEVLIGEGSKALDALDSVSPKFMRKLYDQIHEAIDRLDDDFYYDDSNDDLDESVEFYNKKLDKLTNRLERRLRRGKVKSKLVGKDSKIPGFSYWFQK